MTRPILITGARAPVAIDLARSYAAAGHDVGFADSAPAIAARWSSSARLPFLRLPSPRRSFPAFAAALSHWIAHHRSGLILPTCEEVFYVAAAAERGGFSENVFAPPLDTLRSLHSKIDFIALASSAGIATPQTWTITRPDDLAAIPLPVEQLVFKPEFSRFGSATLIRPDAAQVEKIQPSPATRWVAQTFVPGEEICLWSAARNGQIVAHAAYRPAWRHGRAAAYAFELVDNAACVEVARIIAARTGMTGHLSFDMIVTPEGSVVPIECNPRAVSGLHLFDAAASLAHALTGGGHAVSPTASFRYLAPAMALLGIPAAISQGRFPELFRDWRRGRDALARPGDRWPSPGALADAAVFTSRALSGRRSPSGQTTDDIEWNGDPIA